MARTVHVAGPAAISIDSGVGNSLELLGLTINGAEIREEIFMENVPGDENGGDAGPPIDVQYFGEVHSVRLELSSWDSVVIAKLLPVLYGGVAGVLGTAGTLMGQGAKTFRLLINSSNEPRNYPRAFLRNQKETNKGTKFSRYVLEFQCHAVGTVYSGGGTIYNAVTT